MNACFSDFRPARDTGWIARPGPLLEHAPPIVLNALPPSARRHRRQLERLHELETNPPPAQVHAAIYRGVPAVRRCGHDQIRAGAAQLLYASVPDQQRGDDL